MSNEKLIGKAVSKGLRGSFMKWFAIGLGAAIVVGSVVGVSVYFTLPNGGTPDGGTSEPYSSRLAAEILEAIPNVVYMEIGGNASNVIDARMIWSEFERIGTSEDYYWNTTATLIDPFEEINFEINKTEVEGLAQAMFDSINNTEHVGTFGQPPYDEHDASMKWVTELYLENGTAIFLFVDMNSVLLYKSTTWTGDYQADMNMIGAAVLTPESAFNDYVAAMSALFAPHT